MLYSTASKPAQRWMNSVGLTVAVAIAYFLAARLSLLLLTKPDGVAVFWPAAGVSSGVLIALGPRALLPAIAGTMAATVTANLFGDRNILSAIVFAVSNALEAGLVAALIERYLGPLFSLDRLRNVIGLLAATVVATAVSGIVGALGFGLFHSSTASFLTVWHHWFLSDALGIVTVAPLLIGLGAAVRDRHRTMKSAKAPRCWSCSSSRAESLFCCRGSHGWRCCQPGCSFRCCCG
jgi:integral membrane sensor domain MASE1